MNLLIELLKRLDMDDHRDQMTVLGPNFYKENRGKFLAIRELLEREAEEEPQQYSIIGIDPETKEDLGHVIDVHETFAVVYTDNPKKKIFDRLAQSIGLDVVAVKPGVTLKVMKVLKPRGGHGRHQRKKRRGR